MWQPPEKLPAWSALTPGRRARFEPASPADVATVEAAVGRVASVERIVTDGFVGSAFRVARHDQPAMLFRKHAGHPAESDIAAHELALWLFDHGMPTPRPLVAPTPFETPGAGWFGASTFIDHRPLSPTLADVEALGSVVAALHLRLAEHPRRPAWAGRTTSRLDSLGAVRQRIASGGLRAGPDSDQLAALARRDDLDFVLSAMSRQPLHGDLNAGNVFVGLDDQVLYLIDFEDAPHSVLPVVFELALVLERQIFVREIDDSRATELARGFLDAYGRAADLSRAAMPASTDLWRGILSLNLRSLCVLALLAERGVATPVAEWRKFLLLFDSAEARADAWSGLA